MTPLNLIGQTDVLEIFTILLLSIEDYSYAYIGLDARGVEFYYPLETGPSHLIFT